jgi:glycosyltransferase involved in cell wall biosynthesis
MNGKKCDKYKIMKITLAIPAYNEEKYIGNCLRSVEKYSRDIFEVIVINNASTDKTKEVAQSFSFVRVVDEPKKGLTSARAKVLSEAQGDVIAFMDSDTVMPAGWIDNIKYEFDKNDKLVCLSGPYKYYDATIFSKIGNWVYWVFLGMPTYFVLGYMAVGGNFVASKKALESIGGFDTTIDFYGEDTDIARRLAKVGKVKFSLSFFMYTSARRFAGEGTISTAIKYVVNFVNIAFKGKPYTSEHRDIR